MSHEIPLASFWEHVDAFRNTLLRCLAVILVGTCISFFFSETLLHLLSKPSQNPQKVSISEIRRYSIGNNETHPFFFELPPNARFITSEPEKITDGSYIIQPHQGFTYEIDLQPRLNLFSPLEGMLVSIKVALYAGLTLTMPIWIYFMMQFLLPALKKNEKKLTRPFFLLSAILFPLGGFFAYFCTLPIANQYLYQFNAGIGENLWSLSLYIDFTLFLIFANAIAFEALAIGLALVHVRWISAETLIQLRRPMIVVAFIVAALLTPPDVLTQLLLAFPLILFYELTILYAKFLKT